MWGRSFLEILQPVSFIIIVVVLFEIIVSIVIASFFSEYLIALSIMLMKTLTILLLSLKNYGDSISFISFI